MRKILLAVALAAVAVAAYRVARRAPVAERTTLPLREEEPIGELSTLHAGIATEG